MMWLELYTDLNKRIGAAMQSGDGDELTAVANEAANLMYDLDSEMVRLHDAYRRLSARIQAINEIRKMGART